MVFVLLVIILIFIIIFFRRVFSECTEAIATSLIPLVTNLPEICAFIIGFSFTVWTKMRTLAGSLSDCLWCLLNHYMIKIADSLLA